MKENFLVDLSKQFAVDIVNLCTDIKENRKSNVLLNQVLRSGTSIGLNQFPDKKLPVKLKADGGEIDAISGATVSSVGALMAVSNAVEIYKEIKPLLLETWK